MRHFPIRILRNMVAVYVAAAVAVLCGAGAFAQGDAAEPDAPAVFDVRFPETWDDWAGPVAFGPPLANPPDIRDGPREEDWEAVAPMSVALGGVPDAAPAEIRIGHDADAFYLAANLPQPGLAAVLEAAEGEGVLRPALPFLRLAFAPPDAPSREFAFLPDSRVLARLDGAAAWEPALDSRAVGAKDSWSVVAALPWETVGIPPPPLFGDVLASLSFAAVFDGEARHAALFRAAPRGRGRLVFGGEADFRERVADASAEFPLRLRLHADRWEYDAADPQAWARLRVEAPLAARSRLETLRASIAVSPLNGQPQEEAPHAANDGDQADREAEPPQAAPGEEAAMPPPLRVGLDGPAMDFALDLRRIGAGKHLVRAELLDREGAVVAFAERRISVSPLRDPPGEGRRVRLEVLNVPEDRPWAITGGVPIPKGELRGGNVRLFAADGSPVPAQARPAALWGRGGSVRWLQLDFLAPPGVREVWLAYGPEIRPLAPETPLSVQRAEDTITVDTGAVRFAVQRSGFRLFEKVEIGAARRALNISGQDLFVEDERGEAYYASLDPESTVTVEEEGPLRATLLARGRHVSRDGAACGSYVVRITAFAGSPVVKVSHTFIFSPVVPGRGYRNIALRPGWLGTNAVFGGAGDRALSPAPRTPAYLLQRGPQEFALVAGDSRIEGDRAGGWAAVSDGAAGVALAVRDFWRKYPKEIEWLEGRALVFHVWPRHGEARPAPDSPFADAARLGYAHRGRVLRLAPPASWGQALGDSPEVAEALRATAQGAATTHELALFFHVGDEPVESVQRFGRAVRQNPRLAVPREWLARTGAVGPLPAEQPPERFARLASGPLDCAVNRREALQDYGMVNYGGMRASFDVRERKPDIRQGWIGFHAGGPRWAWAAYHLTGEARHFEAAESWTRHAMDWAMSHATAPPAPGAGDWGKVRGGLARPGPVHWVGGADAARPAVDSLLLTYYRTGCRRAKDSALAVGSALLAQGAPVAGADGSARAHALLGLYRATWNNAFLERFERTLEAVAADEGLGALHAPALEEAWRWTGNPAAEDALKRWAGRFLAEPSPPVSRHAYLGVLAAAALLADDAEPLSLASAVLDETLVSLYLGGDDLVRGDFVLPERPGLVANAAAGLGALLHTLERADDVPQMDLPFAVVPFRIEAGEGEARAAEYRIEGALLPSPEGAEVSAAVLVRADVRVAAKVGDETVFERTLPRPEGGEGETWHQWEFSVPPGSGEHRLTLTSGEDFALAAPLQGEGVEGMVWRIPEGRAWSLPPHSRCWFSVPEGVEALRLELLGGGGLNALRLAAPEGARKGIYWKGSEPEEASVAVEGGAPPGLWRVRRGYGAPVGVRFATEAVPPWVAETPERFFIPK